MVLTVTCNPALDYLMTVSGLHPGETNRAEETRLRAGGKGLNVSRMLATFGVETRAVSFSAGDTGVMLETMLAAEPFPTEWIRLPRGRTRINVKLTGTEETEVNAPGAPVPETAFRALEERVRGLQAGDVLCLSGSLAPGMAPDSYARLLQAVPAGVKAVVDTVDEPLRRTLAHRPFLIKPNRAELSQLVGQALPTPAAVEAAAQTLRQQGVEQVLVSLGGEGALLVSGDGVWYQPAPAGRVRCAVSAGDSMIAGFLTAVSRGEPLPEALRLAVATGSAVTFAGGSVTADTVAQVRRQLPATVRQ